MRKPITTPIAAEFMSHMRGVPAHRIARAMTRACTRAVNFTGCSKSHLANVWSYAQGDGRLHDSYRFAEGTTLTTLHAAALAPINDLA